MNNHPAVPEPNRSVVPSGNDFNSMMRVAEMLAASDLVPSAYRRKPANVLVATLAGQAFGWDPTMAMRSFHIIEGTPSLKPEIMLALVRQAGHSVTGSTAASGATVTGTRRDTGDTMTFTFGPEQAKAAGLANGKNYQKYAASMYWARAISQLCRMLFPDVVLGAGYVPEELGATVAEDGTPIDVASEPVGLTVGQMKRIILNSCDGDKDCAKKIWDAHEFTSDMTEEDILAVIASVSDDIEEAEIVDEEAPAADVFNDPDWSETGAEVVE